MADETFELAGELIAAMRDHGWGLTFDENRHGQWRISRIVGGETLELVSDSDGDIACRLALAELERLAENSADDSGDASADESSDGASDNGRYGVPAAQPLAAPSQASHT